MEILTCIAGLIAGLVIYAVANYLVMNRHRAREVHHIVRRIGVEAGGGVLNGNMADTLIAEYLESGWRLESVNVIENTDGGSYLDRDLLTPIRLVVSRLMKMVDTLIGMQGSDADQVMSEIQDQYESVMISLKAVEEALKILKGSTNDTGYGVDVLWVLVR